MILNLPLDAVVVSIEYFKTIKIMRAPLGTEGVRRKRKLLAQAQLG